jgi:hypothetical protein
MIALVLLARLAVAEDPPTYERLFGEEPVTAAEASAAGADGAAPSPWKLVGPAALGVACLLLAWRMRAGAALLGAGKQLEILSRHPLGDRNTLILLEVIDADGERRRLLVGTGAGAPSLVADLGQVALNAVSEGGPAGAVAPVVSKSIVDEVLAERRSDSFATHATRKGLR